MFKFNRRTLIYYLNGLTSPQSPNPNPFQHYSLPFSLHYFCTKTSDSPSFVVSYLIHNFGCTPQFASKLFSSYNVRFNTAHKPDSVLTFFRNYGFSDSQLRYMILKAPWLLSCDPNTRVLPKFQFLLSKGASTSDIVNLVSKSPLVLAGSLENLLVPTYELVYRFLQSHHDTIACVIRNSHLFGQSNVSSNIRLLVENGMTDPNMARLLRDWSQVFRTRDIPMLVEELKDLGFNPSKASFVIALLAKTTINKTLWKEKVDTFKKWGWSDEDIAEAFRKDPHCMLKSIDKINLVMNFWVNQLGWDAMAIAKVPRVISCSLQKTIIPRASVVQYLLKKGLRKKNASLTTPFVMTDKSFLNTYIIRFKEESSYLLKLYEEKLNLVHTRDKIGMS